MIVRLYACLFNVEKSLIHIDFKCIQLCATINIKTNEQAKLGKGPCPLSINNVPN